MSRRSFALGEFFVPSLTRGRPAFACFCRLWGGQTDLVLEAKHLDAFNANFNGKAWSDCVFPRVIHCVEDVLVRFSCGGLCVGGVSCFGSWRVIYTYRSASPG